MGYTYLLFFYTFSAVQAYKPVFLIHGIMTDNGSMAVIKARIQEAHPGTVIYNTNRFSDWSSLENMWHQVLEFGNDIMKVTESHPEGIHLLGYSQGALVARTLLQAYPLHNVHNFISLSGPQAGQYGTKFLHIIFPGLALKTAYELFYSRMGQHISVGSYWNDPHHQPLYRSYSHFLPYVNNEIVSDKSGQFKEGIIKLKKMILIGGPDDDVITPWQSSQFGYFDKNETVATMTNRSIYINDTIGLKTLNESGRLILATVPGMDHFMWHLNLTVIDKYIIPNLD